MLKTLAAAGATLVVTDRVAASEARKTLDAWPWPAPTTRKWM
ncbi:MAG: hypothetical protein U1F87_05220 [Kiritimatiellia bacterium]